MFIRLFCCVDRAFDILSTAIGVPKILVIFIHLRKTGKNATNLQFFSIKFKYNGKNTLLINR